MDITSKSEEIVDLAIIPDLSIIEKTKVNVELPNEKRPENQNNPCLSSFTKPRTLVADYESTSESSVDSEPDSSSDEDEIIKKFSSNA